MPTTPPAQPMRPFNKAISAIKASNMAPTLSAKCIPEAAPLAAASKMLAYLSSSLSTSASSFLTSWVSGMMILAISKPPGAAIKLAANRYFISTPIPAYPAMTEPAIEANPPTIMANSSERVICGIKGLTTRGASVWPTNILAAADMDSGRLVLSANCKNPPIKRIIQDMIPK